MTVFYCALLAPSTVPRGRNAIDPEPWGVPFKVFMLQMRLDQPNRSLTLNHRGSIARLYVRRPGVFTRVSARGHNPDCGPETGAAAPTCEPTAAG
jgi:hypothetical protein